MHGDAALSSPHVAAIPPEIDTTWATSEPLQQGDIGNLQQRPTGLPNSCHQQLQPHTHTGTTHQVRASDGHLEPSSVVVGVGDAILAQHTLVPAGAEGEGRQDASQEVQTTLAVGARGSLETSSMYNPRSELLALIQFRSATQQRAHLRNLKLGMSSEVKP